MKEVINCEKCKESINNNEESFTCNDNDCHRKYHKNCINLNTDQLKLMETTINCIWICDMCISLHNNINLHQEVDRIVSQKFEKYSELNDLRLKELNKRLNYAEKGLFNKDATTTIYPALSEKPFKCIYHRKTLIIILFAIILGLLMTGFIFGSAIFKSNNNNGNGLVEEFRLVSRAEWQARPPATLPDMLKLPVHRVIISHTATESCKSKMECTYRMAFIQMFHMDSMEMNDIGYNFLIGDDGLVYEARGWDNVGRHTKGYNLDSLGIAFIGTFTRNPPTSNQLKAAQLLLDEDYDITESSTVRSKSYKRSDLRIVARENWIAQSPSEPLVPLNLPVQRVIVISTHTDTCNTQAACVYRVRLIQTFNIESFGQDDIIYNFLIGGDGNVYEGRGWDFTAAHLKGFNDNSISFAYIGTFKKNKPSPKQMNVTKLLLDDGVQNGKLTANYEIVSANKLDPISTKTLANGLYESFKDWPQWAD